MKKLQSQVSREQMKVPEHYLMPCRITWMDAWYSPDDHEEGGIAGEILLDTIAFYYGSDENYIYFAGEMDVSGNVPRTFRNVGAIPKVNILEMRWLSLKESPIKVSSLNSLPR